MKICRAIHSNRGIEAKYRKKLDRMIREMTSSVEYWLAAQYNAAPPRLAQDATPSAEMRSRLREVGKRWIKRFNDTAPVIADVYVNSMQKATDAAFMNALKAAGIAVEFKMTPVMRDAMSAVIAENVGLIKSIPEQYLAKVEGVVMRSYAAGRDLATMSRELRELYPITKKRASLISRDRSNKLNATINRARALEVGITHAIWMHSHGGKEPRQSHVDADGKKFEIAEGCLIDGEYIQPGEKINCRCTMRVVLPDR